MLVFLFVETEIEQEIAKCKEEGKTPNKVTENNKYRKTLKNKK